MKFYTVAIVVCCLCRDVLGAPAVTLNTDSNQKQTDAKTELLKSKLSLLQELFQEIDDAGLGAEKATLQPPTLTPQSDTAREPMTPPATDSGEDPDEQTELAQLAAALSPHDLDMLQAFKLALDRLHTKQSITDKQASSQSVADKLPGITLDEPIADDDQDDEPQSAAVVPRLSNRRKTLLERYLALHPRGGAADKAAYNPEQQLPLDKDSSYIDPDVPSKTPHNSKLQDGVFGKFRSEVMHGIEERLLYDIDLARQNGISLQNIIEDLTAPGDDLRDLRRLAIDKEPIYRYRP